MGHPIDFSKFYYNGGHGFWNGTFVQVQIRELLLFASLFTVKIFFFLLLYCIKVCFLVEKTRFFVKLARKTDSYLYHTKFSTEERNKEEKKKRKRKKTNDKKWFFCSDLFFFFYSREAESEKSIVFKTDGHRFATSSRTLKISLDTNYKIKLICTPYKKLE